MKPKEDGVSASRQYAGILISRDGIASVRQSQMKRFIPREEILQIRLKHRAPGWLNPIALILGAGFVAGGLLQGMEVLIALVQPQQGNAVSALRWLAVAFLLGSGTLLLAFALRTHWVIEAETQRGAVTLVFEQNAKEQAVLALLEDSRPFGYAIDTSDYASE